MQIPSTLGSLVSLGVQLVPESLECHRYPLKAEIFSTANENFGCYLETDKGVTGTHSFTLEPSLPISSSFASNTWWTLQTQTETNNATKTISKTVIHHKNIKGRH